MYTKIVLVSLMCVGRTLAIPVYAKPIGDGPQYHKEAIAQGFEDANRKLERMHGIMQRPDHVVSQHPSFIAGFGTSGNVGAVRQNVEKMYGPNGRVMIPHAEADHRTTAGLAEGKKLTFGSSYYDKGATADFRGGTVLHETSHALAGTVDHFDRHGNPYASPSHAKDANGKWKSDTQFGYADSHLDNLRKQASHNMHVNADSYRTFGGHADTHPSPPISPPRSPPHGGSSPSYSCYGGSSYPSSSSYHRYRRDLLRYSRELFSRVYQEDDLEMRAELIRRAETAGACALKKPDQTTNGKKNDGKKVDGKAAVNGAKGAAQDHTHAAAKGAKGASPAGQHADAHAHGAAHASDAHAHGAPAAHGADAHAHGAAHAPDAHAHDAHGSAAHAPAGHATAPAAHAPAAHAAAPLAHAPAAHAPDAHPAAPAAHSPAHPAAPAAHPHPHKR